MPNRIVHLAIYSILLGLLIINNLIANDFTDKQKSIKEQKVNLFLSLQDMSQQNIYRYVSKEKEAPRITINTSCYNKVQEVDTLECLISNLADLCSSKFNICYEYFIDKENYKKINQFSLVEKIVYINSKNNNKYIYYVILDDSLDPIDILLEKATANKYKLLTIGFFEYAGYLEGLYYSGQPSYYVNSDIE